jgi:hypothetical protein
MSVKLLSLISRFDTCSGEPGTQQCDTKLHLRGRGTGAVLGDCSRVLKTECAQSYDLEGNVCCSAQRKL